MKSTKTEAFEKLLQDHGYRVTAGRIALLTFLESAKKPLSVGEIQKQMTASMDKVTLYRALLDFTASKIVAKINLHETITYYEFIHTGHHHHHIICEKCGILEDIEICNQTHLQKEVLGSSKMFSTINSHSLEFFGICKKCAK